MNINKRDIIEWEEQIYKCARTIAGLRGNVADTVIKTLANTIQDMCFLVSYADSTLKVDVDEHVTDVSEQMRHTVSAILAAEDDRVRQIRETEEAEQIKRSCEFLDSL